MKSFEYKGLDSEWISWAVCNKRNIVIICDYLFPECPKVKLVPGIFVIELFFNDMSCAGVYCTAFVSVSKLASFSVPNKEMNMERVFED